MALSCCLSGLIGLIFCCVIFWVLDPLINKILGWNTAAADGIFKTKLQKKIDKQWPEIDQKVRIKIDAYFDALSGNMGNWNRFRNSLTRLAHKLTGGIK